MHKNLRDENIGRFLSWIIREIPEFVSVPNPTLLPKPKKKVEVDSDDELAELTKKQLNLHLARAIKKAVKSQHKYSICSKPEHNSRKCSRKKKKKNKKSKKGKVNLATLDLASDSNSDSSSDTSSSDSSDFDSSSSDSSDSDDELEINMAKIKKN